MKENISKGIGNGIDEAQEDIQGLTDPEMQSSEVLEKLNNYVIENKTKEGVELKELIE